VQAAQVETERAKGEAACVAERLAQAERDVLALRAHRNPNVDKAAQTELCGKQSLSPHLTRTCTSPEHFQ
jgi:hypothetical protein